MNTTQKVIGDPFAGMSDLEFDAVSSMDAEELKQHQQRKAASVHNGGESTTQHAPSIGQQYKDQKKRVGVVRSDVNCPDCRGSGKFHSNVNGRVVGNCFKCEGTGKITTAQVSHAKGEKTKEEKREAWRKEFSAEIAYMTQRAYNWPFAASMLENIETYGSLTEKQMGAIQNAMTQDAIKKQELNKEAEAKSGEVDVSAIQALFARAVSNDLKRPIFRTEHLTIKASRRDSTVLFVRSTANDEIYYGKIVKNKFMASWASKPETLEQLRLIATDPQAEAVKYGRLTSCCGICGKGLVDPVSIRTGIGPICAERFGFLEAREANRDDIRAEVQAQAAKSDALPADKRAKGVSRRAPNAKPAAAPVALHKPAPSAKTSERTGTKKQFVADLLFGGGSTIAEIAAILAIGEPAARALIGDVKRMGHNVVRDGVTYKINA